MNSAQSSRARTSRAGHLALWLDRQAGHQGATRSDCSQVSPLKNGNNAGSILPCSAPGASEKVTREGGCGNDSKA